MSIKISREQLISLTIDDFKSRYANTMFGYLWTIINPLFMLITLYIVFNYIINLGVPEYQLFLLIGIISWNYFSESTSASLQKIESSRDLLKKHKIEPMILILSSCLSSLISLFVSTIIFLMILTYMGKPIVLLHMLSILYLFILFVISFGTSLLISSIYPHFKDIRHIWSFALLAGFWATPVVYSETTLPSSYIRFYMLNPIARIISHLRNLFLHNYIDDLSQVLITVSLSLIILFATIWLYSYASKNMAEKL
ncbi:MAG: ABC transporter permease [archaeon]